MRHLPDSFEASVSAFRRMTAAPVEGSATRARVLERAERRSRRQALFRRGIASLGVVAVSLMSGAALTAAGLRWRAPTPATVADPPDDGPRAMATRTRAPARIVPVLPSPDGVDGEALAYRRAHRLHFFADAPVRALAAWDAYLADYPRGTFAPEARYNRAICLAQLGRTRAAAEALRPFANGSSGGYRRQEACTLLRWLSARDARVDAGPSCRTRR